MIKKLLHIYLLISLASVLPAQGLQTFDELLSHSFTSSDSLQLHIIDAKKDYLRKDKGLKINSSAGTNEYGDLENGNIFRVKAGFEWNILNEGFMDRKVSAKVLDLDKAILELDMREKTFSDNYAFVYNHIIYCFNKEKVRFLEEKSYLLNILEKRYEALYHSHAAEYQDLLAISDKVDELTILSLSIRNYNRHFENTTHHTAPEIKPNYLPILNIEIRDLLTHQIQDTSFQQIKVLKQEKNKLKNRLDKQKRLAIYNNVYWRPLQETQSNRYISNAIGIRFTSSLTNRKKERAKLDELNDQLDSRKNDEEIFNQQKELSNDLLAYHSKLRTYSRYKYKLRALQENKRLDKAIKLVNFKDPQSDLKALGIDLEQLSVEYELLELKQQLYLLLLKIYKNANVSSILPFVVERDFEAAQKKLSGDRIVVINYANEIEISNIFLAEYLRKNEIESVIYKGNLLENRDFIKTLADSEIDVYTGTEAFVHRNMVEVPIHKFQSRIELEYWIEDHSALDKNAIYVIKDVNQLIKIDSAVLEK